MCVAFGLSQVSISAEKMNWGKSHAPLQVFVWSCHCHLLDHSDLEETCFGNTKFSLSPSLCDEISWHVVCWAVFLFVQVEQNTYYVCMCSMRDRAMQCLMGEGSVLPTPRGASVLSHPPDEITERRLLYLHP